MFDDSITHASHVMQDGNISEKVSNMADRLGKVKRYEWVLMIVVSDVYVRVGGINGNEMMPNRPDFACCNNCTPITDHENRYGMTAREYIDTFFINAFA